MTRYKDAGVDIEQGDKASASAYSHAVSTFASRKGMIGEPVFEENGFAGFLDMGDYYLVQSDDSTGTKIDLAFSVGKLDTLGYDLVAMVADDAVCTGAEPISISNTLDIPHIDPKVVDQLMGGLAKACSEQKIVIPAGEIAEVPGAVEKGVWSATVIGVVEKSKVLKPETIEAGDVIISLKSAGPRCNGYSLIRKILEGKLDEEWKDGKTWGEVMLTPSIVYSNALLELIGRYGEDRKVNVKGLAHITGGGIPSKLGRTLKKSGLGAELTDLWSPHESLVDLIKLGSVTTEEAYKTWNMGNGMIVIVSEDEADKALEMLNNGNIEAKIAGTVCQKSGIVLKAFDGKELKL
ncbi:phosphoribosylformylglycinamidine cyclo-ligase [Patescibacteria group bacterium]|nr:phosphoribosylformylglycinamidine cyclo-ligase [Patescibacteria group bacterium]